MTSADPLYLTLGILPLKKLVIQRIALQMFKFSAGSLPIAISDLFINNESIHTHNTRQKPNLRQQVANREYMYRNFSFIGVYVWNHITSRTSINVETSYNSFKYIIKEHLFTNNITFRIT